MNILEYLTRYGTFVWLLVDAYSRSAKSSRNVKALLDKTAVSSTSRFRLLSIYIYI